MPLLIDLKPGEKIIINGAVLENAGSSTKLRILNDSSILRQKEIMTEDDSATPAARVYFHLQCAYIFPEKRDHYLELGQAFLAQYLEACPSAAPLAAELREEIAGDQLYKGLKTARKLLAHETEVLGHFHDKVAALADDVTSDSSAD
ncbi:MAG: flagellar biosynthesis repressor FlbT [Actinomycetota bacterium]